MNRADCRSKCLIESILYGVERMSIGNKKPGEKAREQL